jgi:hypothetical protein
VNPKGQGTDFQEIVLSQLLFPLDALLIDEGAVGAIEIPDDNLAPAAQQGAMVLADRGAAGPEVTLPMPANDELVRGDRNDFAFALALADNQTQFHK